MEENQSLDELRQIRQMMERSSRFISLSGLSGVAAGCCALAGAWVAHDYVKGTRDFRIDSGITADSTGSLQGLFNNLIFWIALATLAGALISAFVFTWLRSKKQGMPVWGVTARRLLLNMSIPLIAGAAFLLKLMEYGTFGLVAPGCLIFYGLALVNASRYTLNEIRYLGYCQLMLGLIAMGFTGYGIYFWVAGFGVLHIIYGMIMWQRYERSTNDNH
jgi:hypothetical protein